MAEMPKRISLYLASIMETCTPKEAFNRANRTSRHSIRILLPSLYNFLNTPSRIIHGHNECCLPEFRGEATGAIGFEPSTPLALLPASPS